MMMNSLFDGYIDLQLDVIQEILQYYRNNHLPLMWFISPKGKQLGIDQYLDELDIEEAIMKVPGMAIDLSKEDKSSLAG